MDQIIRYIPAEVVGAYVVLGGFLEGNVSKNDVAFGLTHLGWYWVGFWFFLGTSPIWMWLSTNREGKGTQWFQVIVTPFAFAAWALALGGPFKLWLGDAAVPPEVVDGVAGPKGQYNHSIASVILLIVTIGIGLIDKVVGKLAKKTKKPKAKPDDKRTGANDSEG